MNDLRRAAGPELFRRCDPQQLAFATTAELEPTVRAPGQERAAQALAVGIGVPGPDHNVFVMGPGGVGRHTLVRSALAEQASRGPAPSDWVYLNNFAAPDQPIAVELPAGRGAALRDEMARIVAELRTAIPAIFEGEEYAQRVEKIDREFAQRRDNAIAGIAEQAQARGLLLVRTPAGYAFTPAKEGEIIPPETFSALPEEERARIAAAIEELEAQMEKALRDAMRGRKERAERVRELDGQMVVLAVGHFFDDLERRHAGNAGVTAYLEAVRRDTLENADLFRRPAEGPFGEGSAERRLGRYEVNVVVDRGAASKPEVVFCDHPTYANLLGRIEHIHQLGTLVTDFTLIKGGALHRANGGYLVVDAHAILTQPFAWDALKRALTRREARIEPVSELWGLATTVSLQPAPIPLAVKVVMIGERRLYYLLQEFDPDFPRLFKVVCDFDDDVERDAVSCLGYARTIAALCRAGSLLPLDRAAVARLIEEASRRASDARKLSADLAALDRLLRESDWLAREAGAQVTTAGHVAAAVQGQRERAGRLRRRMLEDIGRGTVLIDTAGAKTGQVNGLAVVPLTELPFAEPVRVTATARVGEGHVVDIQRESHLGGNIHSKGVLILSQLIGAKYSANRPLSLSASLVFEQTYGPVEGDSASLAELCALLSALAQLPVRQSFAVTGSVNQLGEVQAVGAVNEKIEGFFEVCRERGLTGEQGVIIPVANVEHLMLREEVVAAAEAGLFAVHPVSTVDEAMELLTGVRAGDAAAAGADGARTVNGRVARRLLEFSRARAAPARIEVSRKPLRRR